MSNSRVTFTVWDRPKSLDSMGGGSWGALRRMAEATYNAPDGWTETAEDGSTVTMSLAERDASRGIDRPTITTEAGTVVLLPVSRGVTAFIPTTYPLPTSGAWSVYGTDMVVSLETDGRDGEGHTTAVAATERIVTESGVAYVCHARIAEAPDIAAPNGKRAVRYAYTATRERVMVEDY